MKISLAEIARHVGGRLRGDADVVVSGLADLRTAGPGQLAFLHNPRYRDTLAQTRASAVLLREEDAALCPTAAIIVANPYLAYARAAQRLDTTPAAAEGLAPTAVVHPSAVLGREVAIGPGAVIAAGVQLGDAVRIGANAVIGEGARIGAGTTIQANVTIYHRVLIGERCLVHSGTVIGADGFGYAQDPTQNQGQWVRIPQLGSVRIGDRVEIGANCTIDRGALDDTVIGDGVIIDNLVHIAHNVHLGENVAIAGCSAIAGSTTLGKGVTLAGRSNVLGHLTIAEGAHVTACTLITHSIDKPGVYSSGTVQQENREWRKNAVRFTQLDEMARRLRALEKLLEQTQQEKKT